MPLPEKQYFSLEDLTKRWETDLANLRYYAEHGLLECETWLGDTVVKVYRLKETKDGEKVPVQSGLRSYNGYCILEQEELRQVFRFGKRAIDKFTLPCRTELFKLFDKKVKYLVEISDLVVSKEERNRFEQEYDLHLGMPKREKPEPIAPPVQPISFAGRPSVMFRIEQEMKRRIKNAEMEPSLKRESEYLHHWATASITDHQVPKPASIANALRASYNRLKETMKVKESA